MHKGILDSGEIQHLASRIKNELEEGRLSLALAQLSLLTSAAALAYRGLIKDVMGVLLMDIDLSTVPTQHLVSLTSRVTGIFDKNHNVTGCDLVTILDNLQCTEIGLCCNNLRREEAQAMVRAMETRVERVCLYVDVHGFGHRDPMNTEDLTKYSGQGKCKVIVCEDVNDLNFIDKLFCWSSEKGWYFDKWDEEEENDDDNEVDPVKISFTLEKKEEALVEDDLDSESDL